MQQIYKTGMTRRLGGIFLVLAIFFLLSGKIFGEGTKEFSPTMNDSLFLATNDEDFGDFAALGGPDLSRLYFKVFDFTTEELNIGLSPRVNGSGIPTQNTYRFQIRDSLTNTIVHGPFEVTGANANAGSWLQASSGPSYINGSGYDTTDAGGNSMWVFNPTANGNYYIEFFDVIMGVPVPDSKINFQWFDFSVVASGTTAMPGRLWSRNWALRSPQQSSIQSPPFCQWDREFNGVFYSFTDDGFVSRVDFLNSGFQGLSFNVAFGTNGPGTANNILLDRQSILGSDETANSAQHMAFINEPDNDCFPSPLNNCGQAEIVRVECMNDSFCIFVTTTLPGQVEIILDFANSNGIYDPDTTDVILAENFSMASDTICIVFDGKKGDGSSLLPGEAIPTILRYTQGVQHYAAYDVEFITNGYCVETIRPLCPGLATNLLYWDDSQITDAPATFTIDESDPGTGQPQTQINGDTCGLGGTRTWDNFQTGDTPAENAACQGTAFGYGEKNTMNTWWFAAIQSTPLFVLPVVTATITGDTVVCALDSTQFFAVAQPDTVTTYSYNWSGPDMFSGNADSTGMIGTAGEYCVTITNTVTNCLVIICQELTVNSIPDPDVTFTCIGNNMQLADINATVSSGMAPFTYLWSNDSTTQNLTDVPPGTYIVTVTDDNGCIGIDSVVFVECCELQKICPESFGGNFACLTDIPAADTTLITVTDFCAPLSITSTDTDNGGSGCVGDTLIVTRTYILLDGAGNMDTCVQTFAVADNVNPTIDMGTCPSDTTVICTNETGIATLGEPTYSDNCDMTLATSNSVDSTGFDGSCLNNVIGTITRNFFGQDDCGNIDSSCIQVITLIDTIAPTFMVPLDTIIQCTVDTLPGTTGNVTNAMDNCQNAIITFSDVVVAGTCPAIDTVLRTWTVEDDCGNMTSAVQTITRIDTVAPIIVAPADTVISCATNSDPVNTGTAATPLDNCSTVTVGFTDMILAGNCANEMTIIRTWSATDDCGNVTMDDQMISMIDTVAPTFTVPGDIIIQCTQDSLPATTGMVTDTTDNCGNVALSFNDIVVPGICIGADTIIRTWTATDACGNSNNQVQLIARIDTVAPIITFCPPNITINCNGSLDTTATGTPMATDNCTDVVITFMDNVPGGTCSTDNPVIRLFTATDGCGNTDTCSQEIVIQDTENPIIDQGSCPMAVTINCTDDPNNLNVTAPTYTDNCSDSSLIIITFSDDSTGFDGSCTNFIIGSVLRTYYGADICGNIDSSCTVQLAIQDIDPPTFTVPADTMIMCGLDTLPSRTGDVTDAADSCQTVTVAFVDSTVPGQCPAEDVTTRIWTVTDACGNEATGSQTITRIDTVGPTFTVPVDTSIICSSDSLPASTGDILDAADNCSTVVSSFSDLVTVGMCPGELLITRTWLVEDACGNTSTGVQLINKIDTIGPTFTPLADTAVVCDAVITPAVLGNITDAADDCSAPIITFSDVATMGGMCPEVGSIVRTWTVSDSCGNITTAIQNISLIDTIAPVIDMGSCPGNILVDCEIDTDMLGAPTYTDACGGAVTITSNDVITGFMEPNLVEGTITRTFYGEDGCGNIDSSCVQVITVQDSVAPTFTFCPADTVLATCPPDADTMFTGVPLYMDNCFDLATLTLTFEDDSMGIDEICFQGTIVRTFTITDPAGNSDSSCIQNIMVNDTTGPAFNAPADTLVDCTVILDDITISGTVTDVTDCSSIADTSFIDVMGMMGCDGMGEIFRIWSVTDGCGNIGIDTQMIMVQDTFNPTLIVPADVMITCEQDPQDTSITGSMLNVSDDCGMTFMIEFTDDVSGLTGCNGSGTIIRTWFATDDCLNIGSMSQTITVIDTTDPTAACQDIMIDFDIANSITPDPASADNGSMDNCGAVSFALAPATFTCEQFADISSLPAVLTVTDDCGNSSTCEMNVLGSGGGGVTITCPEDIIIYLGQGECERRVNYEVLTSPVCGGGDANVMQTDDSGYTSGDFFPIGTTVQSYIASDDFGDSAVCSFSIILIELEVPFDPSCNDTLNISLDQNCEAIINPEIILEGENFGCGLDFIIEVVGIGTDTGFVIVTDPETGIYYTVSITDPESGLSCWGTVIFEDKLPPIIECPCEDYQVIDGDAFTLLGTNDGNTYYVSTGSFSWQDAEGAAIATGANMLSVNSASENQFIVDAFDGNDFRVWIGLTDDEAYGGVEAGTDPQNGWIWADGTAITYQNWSNGEPSNANNNEDYVEMFGNGQWNDNTNTGFIQPFILEVEGICEYTCTDNLSNLPIPIASDACGNATLTFTESQTGEDCEGQLIVRTWVATDESGNTATCSQTFVINPLDLETLAFPENYVGECGGSTSPNITGYPTLNGEPLGDATCNIFTSHWDKELEDCGGGIKILRTWTVIDWCTQEIESGQQIIKLTDSQGPIMTCPENIEVSTDFWYCHANVSIPHPVVTDACGTPFTLELTSNSGIIVGFGNNYVINELAIGTHTITWIATDDCGNSSNCSFLIVVKDDVPPVPLCDQHTVVSLTNDGPKGLTLVNADVFDDGSYDNCGPVTFRARRMDSCIDFDWTTDGAGIDDDPNGLVNSRDRGTVHRPMVPFACCDVRPNSGSLNGDIESRQVPVMVELEITDASGNVNYCMVEIEVQDKLSPFIVCPPDIQLSCDFWFNDNVIQNQFIPLAADEMTSVFGTVLDAYDFNESDRNQIIINDPGNHNYSQPHTWGLDGWADDNCNVNISVRTKIIDDCTGDDLPFGAPANAVRYIERTFRATDNQGNSTTCRQLIWVVDFTPFYISDNTAFNADPNDGVHWPKDELYTTCPDSLIVNYPTIFDDNCSQVGVTYKDTRFDFVDGACYKILREWRVIDWCGYDVNTGDGYWTYTQVIKVLDSDGPAFIDCPTEPVTLCVEDEGVSLTDNNQVFLGEGNPLAKSCAVHVQTTYTVEEFCSGSVKYDVKIYPFNGSDYVQVVQLTTVAVGENGQAELELNTRTSSISSIRTNGLPYNSKFCGDYHRVLWTVEDGCGNFSTCEYLLRLEDCKQPSPVCINGLSTVVMPSNGEITLWAKEFDASSIDDCTPSGELLFSFSGDSYEPSMTFTCDNIPAINVEFTLPVYVADGGVDHNCNNQISWSERNRDFCTTTLVITDNDDVCGGSGSLVSGEIMTHDVQSPVEFTHVELASVDGYYKEMVTIEDGQYHFTTVPLGDSYVITPTRNDNHLNGVSTLDLVRIQKHLLGVQPFESSYQYIAADANNSLAVSALDLVEIRKLILGIYLEFPNNQSWRFVEEGFEFTDPMNPWPFNEQVSIESLNEPINANFMAVKIGDLNSTVQANLSEIATRGARQTMKVKVLSENQVTAGDLVEVQMNVPADVVGFQWTLDLDGLTYSRVLSETVGENNIAIHGQHLAMSFARVNTGNEVSFTLNFIAQKDGKVQDMIALSNEITETEAYNDEEQIFDISLEFPVGHSEREEWALYQNEPNPFTDQSIISFKLQKESSATITIYNTNGQVVHTIEGDYNAGLNKVIVKRNNFASAGLYYYTLQAGDFTASKKMIIAE